MGLFALRHVVHLDEQHSDVKHERLRVHRHFDQETDQNKINCADENVAVEFEYCKCHPFQSGVNVEWHPVRSHKIPIKFTIDTNAQCSMLVHQSG